MIVLCALLLAAPARADGTLAVLELKNKLHGADRDAVDAGYLTDLVRTAVIHQLPSLKVMTRENILTLLEAQGKKLEECEGQCEVDTARLLGADLVISGEVLRFGSGIKLALRLHDAHSGQLLGGAQASGATADALEGQVRSAVVELLQPLGGTQPQTLSRKAKAAAIDLKPWEGRGGARPFFDAGVGGAYQSGIDCACSNAAFGIGGRVRGGAVFLRTPRDSTGSWYGLELSAGASSSYLFAAGDPGWSFVAPAYLGVMRSFGSFSATDEWSGIFLGAGATAGYLHTAVLTSNNDPARTKGRFGLGAFTGPGFEVHLDVATLLPDETVSPHFRVAATVWLGGTNLGAVPLNSAVQLTPSAALTLGVASY